MKKAIYLALIFSLTNCATLGIDVPGSVKQYSSKVDGIDHITMSPAWIHEADAMIGLRWHTNLDADHLVLTVKVRGLNRIMDKNSLAFLVNDTKVSFSPMDNRSNYITDSGQNWTVREYILKEKFIKELLVAKKVYTKISTKNGYLEGAVHRGGVTTFKSSAKTFFKKLKDLRSSKKKDESIARQ